MHKNFFLHFNFFLALIFLCFSSCSQNSPEIKTGTCSIVYDYSGEKLLPEVSLAVFSSTDTNPRRFSEITMKSLKNDFFWTISYNDIIRFNDGKKNYVGFTNAVLPDGYRFRDGYYQVIYKALNDEDVEITVNLKTDQKIFDLDSTKALEYIRGKSYKRKVAAYNSKDILIFYGNLTAENSTLDKLKRNNPDAEYYKEVWYSGNGQSYIIMPKKQFNTKNKK